MLPLYEPLEPVCETMEPYTLLIIARTQSLAKRLRSTLDAERYLIRWLTSSTQALDIDISPSLLILELPPSGGERSVTRLKRQFDAPLLALTHGDQSAPEPADGSLPRSGPLQDLVEQIEITLFDRSPHHIRAGTMSLDMETRRLQVNGELHQLRPLACEILALLMARPGDVIPREELYRQVWQTTTGDSTRALDVHIAHLRRQLEPDPRNPTLIQTERGVGYWLQIPE